MNKHTYTLLCSKLCILPSHSRPALWFAEFLWKRSKGQRNCQWFWWDYKDRSGHWGGKQNQVVWVTSHSRDVVSRSVHGLLGTSDTQKWQGSLFCQVSVACCVSGLSGGTLCACWWSSGDVLRVSKSCLVHVVTTLGIGSGVKGVWGLVQKRRLPWGGRFLC